jgi:CcmD family protein
MKNFEFLFAAYVITWLVFFLYDFTLSARIARLREEVERLRELLKQETASGGERRP